MKGKALKYIGYTTLAAVVGFFASSASESEVPDMHISPYAENRSHVIHEYPNPEYLAVIDSTANIIADSVDYLEPFMEKLLALRSGADGQVSILHIGDSHIQAGYWTARVRELFHNDFGNAGRGLITPYKLSRTNEPPNYAITTPHKYNSYRASENGMTEKPDFTGVSVSFRNADAEFEIWSKTPFDAVTIFHHPSAPMLYPPDELMIGSNCIIENTATSTRIVLSQHVDTLKLAGVASLAYDNPTFYGFSLENGDPGVLYHAVGANGAAFEHISSRTTLTEGGAAPLNPDLIIVSLGTNNCYGNNFRSEQLRQVVRNFITNIKSSYPEAALLMTTPMESCNRSRGRYSVNPNVAVAAQVIAEEAAAAGVACWNLWAAAGGNGSHSAWHGRKLMQNDRIHLTEAGYSLVGDMLYDAIAGYYNNWLYKTEAEVERIEADSLGYMPLWSDTLTIGTQIQE